MWRCFFIRPSVTIHMSYIFSRCSFPDCQTLLTIPRCRLLFSCSSRSSPSTWCSPTVSHSSSSSSIRTSCPTSVPKTGRNLSLLFSRSRKRQAWFGARDTGRLYNCVSSLRCYCTFKNVLGGPAVKTGNTVLWAGLQSCMNQQASRR